uniref:Uncharacterized protein n=1 Tax=Anopheles melas TaxID=34690 RepID=A0A182TF98_9DIPT
MKRRLLALEAQHRVSFQVGNVQLLALGNDFRMLAAQQPADVREEKATGRIMRIRIRFRVFVVHPVVAGPVQRTVLERDRVKHGQDDAQGQLRLVRPMGPQTMRASRNAQSGHDTSLILRFSARFSGVTSFASPPSIVSASSSFSTPVASTVAFGAIFLRLM